MHAAQRAERKNSLRELKKIGDEVRAFLGELPPDAEVPPGGYDDLGDITFRDRLTSQQIRFRVISRMTEVGKLDEFLKSERKEARK